MSKDRRVAYGLIYPTLKALIGVRPSGETKTRKTVIMYWSVTRWSSVECPSKKMKKIGYWQKKMKGSDSSWFLKPLPGKQNCE